MSIEPREFTDAEAVEFKLAMKDPIKWKELYEKTEKRSKALREKQSQSKKRKLNEYGFTNEEVDYIKDTFAEKEPVEAENRPVEEKVNNSEFSDDDAKFWDDVFEEDKNGGRRKHRNRRTRKHSRKHSRKHRKSRKSKRHHRKRR
jgi:hypothetical protein